MKPSVESRVRTLREAIRAARGEIPSDLVLKSGWVLDVFCGEFRECDVAVRQGRVVGLGPDYSGSREVDCSGKWVIPGLLDGHYHIESSMLLPSGLAAALAPCGTTALVADPHEIANVMGLEGIRLMLEESESIPLDIFFMAPSCVPATHLETSGGRLTAYELKRLLKKKRIIGLAEVMNVPDVLAGSEEILEKLALFHQMPIDGHAPALAGRDLQAYLAAGVRSDHETTDRQSGLEKVRSGMMLMIREGSSARNLEELAPLVTPQNFARFCFVSDDLHPRDILSRGHLNHMMRKAVRLGMDPVTAVRLGTISPAQYFRLHDRGAVAPGYRADLAVLSDLEGFKVERVYKDGELTAQEGNLCWRPKKALRTRETRAMNLNRLSTELFRIPCSGGEARIIELIPDQILTRAALRTVKSENGYLLSDPEADILKLAVLERHHGTGNVGLGLVRGFGLKAGALASSVSHDSHNIIAVGVGDEELRRAVREVADMGGGMAVADRRRILSRMPLEIAGLMTAAPIQEVSVLLQDLARSAASLGCVLPEPFMVLSFLALPVIPELRLTDMGLVDVNRFEVVPLFF